MCREATWENGKRTVTGTWDYNWAGDFFNISLNSRDRVTGSARQFRVWGDAPEWGNWKLVRRAASAIEAPSGGETADAGSTEGESAAAESRDANTSSAELYFSKGGVKDHG